MGRIINIMDTLTMVVHSFPVGEGFAASSRGHAIQALRHLAHCANPFFLSLCQPLVEKYCACLYCVILLTRRENSMSIERSTNQLSHYIGVPTNYNADAKSYEICHLRPTSVKKIISIIDMAKIIRGMIKKTWTAF